MVKFEESFEIRVTLLLDMTNFLNKSPALVTVKTEAKNTLYVKNTCKANISSFFVIS